MSLIVNGGLCGRTIVIMASVGLYYADMARSKAYRWGEEGIGGFSRTANLCVGLALWNGKDAILKERLFGLTNGQGNHGEDVKELYYHLDSSPTHSYMKMLYKYPFSAFPYESLISENAGRDKTQPEFELIDTELFDHDEYGDVFIEYAKNKEEDLLIKYTVFNRSAAAIILDVIPQLWYRNTWFDGQHGVKPEILNQGNQTLLLRSDKIGDYHCYTDGNPKFLFTDNESNNQRLYQSENHSHYVKDGINDYIVNGNQEAVNADNIGTKAGIWHHLSIPAGGSSVIRIRLSKDKVTKPFGDFDDIFALRIQETDTFYAEKQLNTEDSDEKNMQRQAWAGMFWNKQFYSYDVNRWLIGDGGQPVPPKQRKTGRNSHWKHFVANDILSMPDKWEYPWVRGVGSGFSLCQLCTFRS